MLCRKMMWGISGQECKSVPYTHWCEGAFLGSGNVEQICAACLLEPPYIRDVEWREKTKNRAHQGSSSMQFVRKHMLCSLAVWLV